MKKSKNIKKESTLGIIKPDSVQKKSIGKILDAIEQKGFVITKLTVTKLSQKKATSFYAVHKELPFFKQLVRYMTSGPIIAFEATKENAVEDYRKLIGNTDPKKAIRGTIRRKFGIDKEKNAVHGSDSKANAIKEIRFFFGKSN